MSAKQRCQGGFSLIEVLVTTVVFSIGVLGISGLNAFSKRAGFESVQRSTASELAFAMLEDMRANTAALDVYLGAGTLGGGSRGAEPPACDTSAADCDSAEFAAHALWEWERMIDTGMESVGDAGTGGLVSPSACIDGPAGGGTGNYSVTVVWRGVTELTDSGFDDCGAASGLYGAGNEFRRMVIVETFIDPIS